MRLVLYTGKGGVGKTTLAAATAARAAELGRRTLVASADAAHSLGDVLEQRLGPTPRSVAPGLHAVEIDARAEMASHWGSVRDFLVAVFQHQGIDSVVAEELALLPGAEEIATLLAVERFAASGEYEVAIVDCAPTDSALRLVTLPEVAHRALRLLLPTARALASVGTPVARKLVSVPLPGSEVFRDAERLVYDELEALHQRILADTTSVRIVLTPERMVIDEARRAYTELSLFEISCDAVIMNRLLPEEAAREAFFRDWSRLQEERLREVEEAFAPLPLLEAPLFDDEVTGLGSLRRLGRELFARAEPDAVLAECARVRFARDDRGYFAELPLPGARAEDLHVAVVDNELVVTAGPRRRVLALPRRMAALPLASARLEDDALRVRFGRAAEAG